MVPLEDQCKEIKAFMIEWNNIQKPEECNGQQLIKVQTFIKGACIRDQVRLSQLVAREGDGKHPAPVLK